jgi:hypothetical protein
VVDGSKDHCGSLRLLCLLVMIGFRADGAKELIALDDGHRENSESQDRVADGR